jgi:ceramide glucosyltransferase
LGQIFTHPLPLAMLVCGIDFTWWPVLVAALALRSAAVWATAGHVLRDPLTRRRWWLVPLQDVANMLVWCAGFFGNTILWRGRRYWLLPDGRFELVQ